jgi:hypothetical protein
MGNTYFYGRASISSNLNKKYYNYLVIATTVYEYTSNYSNREIIFSGSTPSRTRLYRMAIGKNYEELSKDFYIFGVIVESGVGKKVPFSNNTDYIAFIVERKPLKLEL